eukprot:s27_g17.t1
MLFEIGIELELVLPDRDVEAVRQSVRANSEKRTKDPFVGELEDLTPMISLGVAEVVPPDRSTRADIEKAVRKAVSGFNSAKSSGFDGYAIGAPLKLSS